MKIVEKRRFDASPSELWGIVHDPGNMPAWNPKCIACDSPAAVAVGEQFAVTYEMKGKRKTATGELVDYRADALVHFRYDYEESSRMGIVEEIFELIPNGDGSTMVKHTVDFSRSALPFWLKYLLGFLSRFGRNMGEGPLDGIEALLPKG